MELTARGCRAARTVHEPVPIQSQGSLVSERPKPYLDRLAQSRWGSVPASSSGPTDPVLRANLFPKLQIRLADFPYLHCSTDQRLFTLETCCGYGYDLRRESTLVPQILQGPASATPDAAPDAALYGATVPISDRVGFIQTHPLQRRGTPASVFGLHSSTALTV